MQFKTIAAILLGITASGAIANPVAAEGLVAREEAAKQGAESEQAPAAAQHWDQDWNNNNRYQVDPYNNGRRGGRYFPNRRGGYGRRGRNNYIDCNQCQDYYDYDDDDDDDWYGQNYKRNDYQRNYGRRGYNGGRGLGQCGRQWNYQQCRWY